MQLGVTFNEHHCDGYNMCDTCGGKVMLVSAPSEWSVDQEAFKSGENTSEAEDVPEDVFINAEVTGHYCQTCDALTSFSFNQ